VMAQVSGRVENLARQQGIQVSAVRCYCLSSSDEAEQAVGPNAEASLPATARTELESNAQI